MIKIIFDLRNSDPSDHDDIMNIGNLSELAKAWKKDTGVSFKVIDVGEPVHDDSRLSIDFTSVDGDTTQSFKEAFKETSTALLSQTDIDIMERHMALNTRLPGNIKEPRWLHIHL